MKHLYSKHLYHTDQRVAKGKYQEIFGKPFDKAQAVLATYNLRADIIPSTKSGATSTFDEAYDFAVFLRTHPMERIILVTDAFHTARAHYAFRKILDINGYENIKIQMSAASNDIFDEATWYKTELGVSMYILEPIKYLFYLFHTSNTKLLNEY